VESMEEMVASRFSLHRSIRFEGFFFFFFPGYMSGGRYPFPLATDSGGGSTPPSFSSANFFSLFSGAFRKMGIALFFLLIPA